jgi:hypothetical protein
VTGSKGGNAALTSLMAALTSLMAALAALGMVTDTAT